MRTVTYSESRAKYAETLNAVVDDREEIIITRVGHEPVVIVALDDYECPWSTATAGPPDLGEPTVLGVTAGPAAARLAWCGLVPRRGA